MSINHAYQGLPKVPASANLPKKPAPQSVPLDNAVGQPFEPWDPSKILRMNAQADTRGPRPGSPRTAELPRLSSTTKDILARVQSERGTSAWTGQQKGSLRETNPITSLLTPSTGAGYGNVTGQLSNTSTSSNPAAAASLSAQPASNLHTGGVFGNASSTNSELFQDGLDQLVTASTENSRGAKNQSRPDSSDSTIQVTSNANSQGSVMPAPASTKPTPSSARRQREYVLQDGTIVNSGKGLGRGRPGIKRGPRRPKLDATNSKPVATNIPAASSATGKKRKHSVLTEDEEHVKTRVSVSDDADSDDYTPKATHTRSGRHTQKPSTFMPNDTPAPKKPRLAAGPSNAPGKPLLIKKKVYRGREQNALCERCLRGRGPVDNAIVFCDGCNLCWHQRCHDPWIQKELVMDKMAEWFCGDCVVKLELIVKEENISEQQRDESELDAVNASVEVTPNSSAQPVLQTDVTGGPAGNTSSTPLIGARSLTLDQRRRYLTSLSRQQLLDLLLHASHIAPDLPIFPAPAPRSTVRITSNLVSTPTNTTTTTTSQSLTVSGPSAIPSTTANAMRPPPPPPPSLATASNPNLNPTRAAKAAAPKYTSPSSPSSESTDDSDQEEDFEEEEEDYGPSHSKCYPMPGHGVMSMLPPDKADEHMLLEGLESRTFSHSLKGQGPLKNGLGEEDKENWIHEDHAARDR